MNVEKNRQNKPLIPQKFLQSIMFLLCMCHTTAITYKFLSLQFSLISTANPVSVMKTGVYFVHITTAGNYFFITGNPVYITGNPILITENPVYVTENPVFIKEILFSLQENLFSLQEILFSLQEILFSLQEIIGHDFFHC